MAPLWSKGVTMAVQAPVKTGSRIRWGLPPLDIPLRAEKLSKENRTAGRAAEGVVVHRIITAAAKVEEFRYRIEGEKVVCYDSLLPEATVGRADHTFSFASFEYDPDELTFILKAKVEMERLQTTTGLNKEGTFHPNAIHYSAVPWLTFTDMKHPTNMRSGDSVPKISTGKYFREGEKLMLPISVTCHHGLMDGYHVAKFIESLDL